jgi:Fibrobacter succinogenes major domain (Fib_succ_major).
MSLQEYRKPVVTAAIVLMTACGSGTSEIGETWMCLSSEQAAAKSRADSYCAVDPLNCGIFVDGRDSHTYRWVKIGSQTWMSENLVYASGGKAWCYGNIESNCLSVGRLYDWNTAMAGAPGSTSIPSGVQGVCPMGWHLPSDGDFYTLTSQEWALSGARRVEDKSLKASGCWLNSGSGQDDLGFSILPSGNYWVDKGFAGLGYGQPIGRLGMTARSQVRRTGQAIRKPHQTFNTQRHAVLQCVVSRTRLDFGRPQS